MNTFLVRMGFLAAVVMGQAATGQVSLVELRAINGALDDAAVVGLSADGTTVVGRSTKTYTQMATLWKNGGAPVNLGTLYPPGYQVSSMATGVSGDGSIVAGFSDSTSADRRDGFRWTAGSGMKALPNTGGSSNYFRVSGDGSTIVGEFYPGTRDRMPSRWRESTGVQILAGLEDRPGIANGTSTDGNTVAGWLRVPDTSDNEAFAWNQVTGPTTLPLLAPWNRKSEALDISANGMVAVGSCRNQSGRVEAVRWTNTGVNGWMVQALGALPGGNLSYAQSASGDGSIVGGITKWESGDTEGTLWTPDLGTVTLNQFAAHHGLDLAGWKFGVIMDISDGGRTFIADAFNPQGGRRATVLHVPAPMAGSAFAGMSVLMIRRRQSQK
ncbi:MAG: hypothetical protein IT432_15970 [Phycisphaerales bacterium]|nr:hypothetical protein [Phycisphaerales bacterium]